MFRGVSNLNIKKKFICRICKYVDDNIPQHHEKDMKWQIKGAFEKIECLCCEECDFQQNIPLHCNVPMFYSESKYPDIPRMTPKDYVNMNDLADK